MALRKIPHPEEAATGPRGARPEDRLRSCLEGRKVLIQLIVNFLYGLLRRERKERPAALNP
jgi:hypothetical protein